jgi:hypothetical protein
MTVPRRNAGHEQRVGVRMLRKSGALPLLAVLLTPVLTPAPAAAAELPAILGGPRNPVPECVTPGRLMTYLKLRNPELDSRYDGIATEYMRYGEALGLRWDFAFYQMIVETGALSYWRGNRHGDVKPSQNNFAGLGATGRGAPGESFPDIATGVRAHLEHLMLYAGRPVDNPAAQRTRNVREWGVLDNWHKTFTRPITFRDMASKWAPGTRSYVSMLQAIADRFHSEVCGQPDPRPELVHAARGGVGRVASATATNDPAPAAKQPPSEPPRPTGADLAQRAIDQAKADGTDRRFALGAQMTQPPAAQPPPAPYKVLNAPPPADTPSLPADAAQPTPPANKTAGIVAATGAMPTVGAALAPNAAPPPGPPAEKATRTASAAGAAAKAKLPETAPPPAANQRCRVWTASYGGQKAMIIRSVTDQVVNFTVLDVNDGSEQREAEAFISAYAKNGKIAGEYPSQAQALDKAFELCPEG